MPYAANEDLPDSVQEALPSRAETIWREAFNKAHEADDDEGRAAAIAWTAVRKAGYGAAPDGRWLPRSELERITYKPTERMQQNAAMALEVRATKPPSQRGMTPVGLARARDLANGKPLSFKTIQRMYSYLKRHEVDKQGKTWDEKGKGWQAWNGWGGDAALRWSASILREALGENGGAATPALPSERRTGSKKNPEGSASGTRGGIEIDEQTEATLRKKLEEHNGKHGDDPAKKTDLGALKAVFRRGAGAFSASHRPGMGRNQWAFGRVDAFLYLLRNGRPENKNYKTDNDLLPADHPRSTRGE